MYSNIDVDKMFWREELDEGISRKIIRKILYSCTKIRIFLIKKQKVTSQAE